MLIANKFEYQSHRLWLILIFVSVIMVQVNGDPPICTVDNMRDRARNACDEFMQQLHQSTNIDNNKVKRELSLGKHSIRRLNNQIEDEDHPHKRHHNATIVTHTEFPANGFLIMDYYHARVLSDWNPLYEIEKVTNKHIRRFFWDYHHHRQYRPRDKRQHRHRRNGFVMRPVTYCCDLTCHGDLFCRS